jgi:predicted transcriptional regulator
MYDNVYIMSKKKTEKKDELISVRVSNTLRNKLEAIAEENDRPLSWVVNKILEKYTNSKQAGKL